MRISGERENREWQNSYVTRPILVLKPRNEGKTLTESLIFETFFKQNH